jgi:hypothetical protein
LTQMSTMVAKVKTGPLTWIPAPQDPGFYCRMDGNFVDEENWNCFVNSVSDKETRTWTCFKRVPVDAVDNSKLFK